MTTVEHVAVDVKDITLAQAQGPDLALGPSAGCRCSSSCATATDFPASSTWSRCTTRNRTRRSGW